MHVRAGLEEHLNDLKVANLDGEIQGTHTIDGQIGRHTQRIGEEVLEGFHVVRPDCAPQQPGHLLLGDLCPVSMRCREGETAEAQTYQTTDTTSLQVVRTGGASCAVREQTPTTPQRAPAARHTSRARAPEQACPVRVRRVSTHCCAPSTLRHATPALSRCAERKQR